MASSASSQRPLGNRYVTEAIARPESVDCCEPLMNPPIPVSAVRALSIASSTDDTSTVIEPALTMSASVGTGSFGAFGFEPGAEPIPLPLSTAALGAAPYDLPPWPARPAASPPTLLPTFERICDPELEQAASERAISTAAAARPTA